ncbi:hypothetical protein TNCV_5069601 [Trichonephila clavipes]|nr:hypothetical protein TNCV_5069601 [Trichonephila clavipes]
MVAERLVRHHKAVTPSLGTYYPTHSIHIKAYSLEQVAKRRRTRPWGHCVLFDLGAAPTLRLKVIMDIGVPTGRQ